MDIHHAIQSKYDTKIVGTIPFKKVNSNHNINENEYIQWKYNPFFFFNSIVFIHERKFLLLFWILNHLLFQKIKIIYVHHNIFHNHRFLSVMPDTIISISNRSTENLIKFFNAPAKNIHLIHNCVSDINPKPHRKRNSERITLLLPARINDQKRQLEIYQNLKSKLDSRITIKFAGDGPFLEQLKTLVKNDTQFECLGFRSDVIDLLQQCDYILLFSKTEGLSITLIEATMCGVPIITNDVGGNLEIARRGKNAFIANDWNELVNVLNQLPNQNDSDYFQMCKNSREIYEKNFTFDKFKQQYLKILENLSPNA